MMSNAKCWKRQLVVLAIATSLLSGCGALGSNSPIATVCPPVINLARLPRLLAA